MAGFVDDLVQASPAFAELWAGHDVALPETTLKIFGHHLVGEVRLRVTSLTVTTAPATRMLVYTPTDEASRAGVAWLAGHPDAPACDHHHHHEAAV